MDQKTFETADGPRAGVHPAVLIGSPRVLVVDGSRSSRELLRLHLSNAGYDVIVAEDAIVAGKEVLARAPDLIVVEVDLPYMNGIEFVAALQADGTIPDIPVILLSVSGDVAQHAQRTKTVAHLSKPVSADRLLHVVALHAGQAGQGP